MGAEGTSAARRPWGRSFIVLLIGLAYLGAVYAFSPALRRELAYYRYVGPFRVEARRVARRRVLAPLDAGLFESAQTSAKLRATATIRRWDFPWEPETVDGGLERDVSAEYSEYQAVLLRDGPERLKIVVEGSSFWGAFIRTGTEEWHVYVDEDEPDLELEYSPRAGWLSPMLWEWASTKDAIPLFHHYIDPDDLLYLSGDSEAAPAGHATYQGKACRVVRWTKSLGALSALRETRVPYERWDLWIREEDSVLVKAEHSYLDARGKPAGPQAPNIICEITSFEVDAVFKDDDFEPGPLIRRFSAAAEKMAGRTPDDADETGERSPDQSGIEDR